MKKKLVTIGFELPGYSELFERYYSNQSLLDADIILFEPIVEAYDKDFDSTYQGKTLYSENGSFRLLEDTQHWAKELSTALEAGKTVIVFFSRYQEFFIHTGRKEPSGKGKGLSIIVESYNNYKFLPFKLPPIVPKGGKGIIFTGNTIFSTLWSEFQDDLEYESYIDGDIENPLFLTRTGNKVIGALFRIGKGNLAILPPIRYDEDKFKKYDDNSYTHFWTKAAKKFGNRLFKLIIDIDNCLRNESEKTPPPSWIDHKRYNVPDEIKAKRKIRAKSTKVNQLIAEKNDLIVVLDRMLLLKNLLFEKGKLLEHAIIEALKILGYKAEPYDNGFLELDQVITSPEGDRFIGEAEGKDCSAVNIDKMRQLITNIQEDLQRATVQTPAIGILFANGYR